MEKISDEILRKFKNVTKFDIKEYFNEYVLFVDNDYNKILNFYSGLSSVSNKDAFNNLDRLFESSKRVIGLFEVNAIRFNNQEGWNLLENVETTKEALMTIKNLNKYLRSSITQSSYVSTPQLSHVAKQGEMLEDINEKIIGNKNKDNWTQVAIDNGLNEEDYSNDGGYIVKTQLSGSDLFSLSSVVGGITELEDSYGKDINKTLSFLNDDLAILTAKKTLYQSAEILIGMNKGDNPLFPNRGLNKRLAGGTFLAVSYPVIFRQIKGSFSSDDSFKSVAIKNIFKDGGATNIELEIETKVGDFINETIII